MLSMENCSTQELYFPHIKQAESSLSSLLSVWWLPGFLGIFAVLKELQVLKMHEGPQVVNFSIFLQCTRALVSAASALTCSHDIILPQSSCADEKHLSLFALSCSSLPGLTCLG